jgi:hypothetical protein
VSILSRISRQGHLDDADLAAIWSDAESAGDPIVRNPHLASCAECRAKYADFCAWLTGIRDDAIAEADVAFPVDRLVAQQAQVLRRLEAMERPARVIAFPRLSRTMTAAHSRPQRWVAAAAAAGLIVGIAAGQMLNLRPTFNRSDFHPVAIHTAQTPSAGRSSAPPVNAASDEMLMYEAATRSHLPALESIDALTPRMRDQELPK